MSKKFGFRIVKERGRYLLRKKVSNGTVNRAATPEERVLWEECKSLVAEVERLQQFEEAMQDAERMAKLASVSRRHIYECLRRQSHLIATAEKCADMLRAVATCLEPEYKSRRDVARDVASEVSRSVNEFKIASRSVQTALGVGMRGEKAERPA